MAAKHSSVQRVHLLTALYLALALFFTSVVSHSQEVASAMMAAGQ